VARFLKQITIKNPPSLRPKQNFILEKLYTIMNAYFKKTRASTICLLLLLQCAGIIYGNNKIDSCLQALALYEGKTESIPQAKLLHELGQAYLLDEAYQQSESYFQQSLKVSIALEEAPLIIKNYTKLAITAFWLAKYEAAIDYAFEPIENYTHLLTANDSLVLFRNLAHAYHYVGNLED